MPLYLYDKTSTSFNNEGLGVLLDFVDEPEVTENINGFFELTFTYALGCHLSDYLTEEMYISTQTNEHDDDYLVFRIYESEPDYVEGTIIIRARLKQTDDFMNSIVKARTLLKGDIGFQVRSLMENAIPTLNYRVGGTINGVLDIEREDDNIYNMLFDDSGLFTLNGVTPKFTPEGITITKDRAWSTASVITEKNFIEQLTINTSRHDMVTQIIPFTETRRDVLTPNEDSKYHKRETIEEKVYGKPVISPKVVNMGYPVITRFMEFRNDVKEELKMDETEYNTYLYESVDDLNEKAKTFFTDNEGIDEYEVEVSIETLGLHMDDYEQISSLGLYDIVEIYLEEYGVNIPVQVMEVTYSPLIGRNTQLKLTSKLNRIEHASNRINSNAPSEEQLREFIQNQIINNKINETVHNFIIKDDGTKISYVNQLPPVETAIEGDVVFLVTEEGGSIWEFVNGAWVEVLPLNFKQYVTDQLTEVFNQFDTERIETEQVINEALDSAKAEAERLDNERQQVIDGKFEVVNKANEKLEQSIATAEQNAQDALTKAGASVDLASTAKQASDNALSQFQTTSADLAEAKATAEETLQNAINALSGANSVITQSQTLLDNATQAKTEATNALLEAQKQLEASGVISGNLTTFKNEVNNTIKGYVTKSTYDSNNQTLNTRMTEWEKTADGIKTSISEVEGKIDVGIHGRNLILNSGMPVNLDHWTQNESIHGELSLATHVFWKNGTENVFRLDAKSSNEKTMSSSRFYIKPNTEYNFSMFVFGDTNVVSFDVHLLYRLKGETVAYSGTAYNPGNIPNPAEATKFVWKFKTIDNPDLESAYIRIDHNGRKDITKGSGLFLTNIKLAEGSIVTDWSPAIEDTVTQAEYAVYKNETEETVKGFTRTVSAYEQDVTGYKNQVAVFNQTVDGYKSEVAKQTETVGGLTTEVANYKQAVDGYSSELSKNTTATNGYKTEVAGYKQTVSGYSSKLAEYTQSNNTLTAKVNSYEATVDGYSQSLTRVEGKIDGLEVGGRNLITNSKTLEDNLQKGYNTSEFYNGYVIAKGAAPTTGYRDIFLQYLSLPTTSEEYILSFWAKADSAVQINTFFYASGGVLPTLYSESSQGVKIQSSDGRTPIDLTTEWTRYWVKFKTKTSQDIKKQVIFRVGVPNINIYVAGPAVYSGNLVTDVVDAPEDLVSQSEYTTYQNQVKSTTDEHTRRLTALTKEGGRISKVEQKADSIQTSLSSYAKTAYVDTQITNKAGEITTNLTKLIPTDTVSQTEFQTVKETTSLYERVIGKTESNVLTNVSRIAMTSDLFQIAIGDSGNLVTNGNFRDGSTYGWDINWDRLNNADPRVNGWYAYTNVRDTYSTQEFDVVPKETLQVEFRAWSHTEQPFTVGILPYDKYGNELGWIGIPLVNLTSTPTVYQGTIKVPDKATKAKTWVSIQKYSDFKDVYFNGVRISRTPSVDQVNSRFTQTREAINLGLYGDKDAISEVGIVKDGVRIKGKLITLDGQVNMTSSFIVPEGNIGNLNASKITAGQIDSARINVSELRSKILTTNVVKSTHILANEALFTKLFTDDLATQKLATKQAWIKSSMIGEAQIGTAQISQINASNGKIINLDANTITTGTIRGINISGGVLTALNGSVDFDLNNGQLHFKTNEPAIKRVVSGYPNQMIKFETTSALSNVSPRPWVDTASTIIGSNRYFNDYAVDDNFVGIRILNTVANSQNYVDRVDIIGDRINLTHTGFETGKKSDWVFFTNITGGINLLYPENAYNTKHDIGSTGYPINNVSTRNMTLQTPLNPNQDLVEILMNIHWHLSMLHDRTGGSGSKSSLFNRLK